MPFGNRKIILKDLSSSALSQFNKYRPSEKLNINNFGIFQILKLRIFVRKILPVSLKLNFTPNTFGCYGLSRINLKTEVFTRKNKRYGK